MIPCLQEKMSVSRGKGNHGNAERQREREAQEEKKLAEMMIPKKKRQLYNKIVYSRKRKAKEASSFMYSVSHTSQHSIDTLLNLFSTLLITI